LNKRLAPAHQSMFGDYWVLWYKLSNSYSVIDNAFKRLLDYYLESNTVADFENQLAIDYKTSVPKNIVHTIEAYLKSCNKATASPKKILVEIDLSHRSMVEHYSIRGKAVKIYYDSELVLKTIHPGLAHLAAEATSNQDITFDIYIKEKQLYLFKNEQLICCVPQRDYHLMQGQFIMHLICLTHHKVKDDWIGTFHGSTLTDGNSSVLFVGASGKGKSTLCALLAANGFDLVADDVSPMLSLSKNMYYNPSAISIKEGAFNTLEPLVDGFKDLPVIQFNKSKGLIKYIPCKSPEEDFYPCRGIILVNYKPKAETKLENVSIKTILETLIPESWLSPNPIHAKEFLDWLETVHIFQLTYSDTKSVTEALTQLFQELKKN
jgi:hypothetical protein